MIKLYKVIEEFNVYTCDEECDRTEDMMSVKVGEIYEYDDESQYRGGCNVWLDGTNGNGWLDINEEDFKQYFKEVE